MIEITDKTLCCGCTACYNICPINCIEMQKDREGFLYPSVDTNLCIGCKRCEKVCPIINCEEEKENSKQFGAIVANKEEQICRQSTSGGAFSAIAEYIIRRGGIVFGVEMQRNLSVHHIEVENIEDLVKFRN